MVKYLTATLDDLIEDAQENDRVDALKAMANKKHKGKDISFLVLKRQYFLKYYPDMVPKAKPKKQTFKERINSL